MCDDDDAAADWLDDPASNRYIHTYVQSAAPDASTTGLRDRRSGTQSKRELLLWYYSSLAWITLIKLFDRSQLSICFVFHKARWATIKLKT